MTIGTFIQLTWTIGRSVPRPFHRIPSPVRVSGANTRGRRGGSVAVDQSAEVQHLSSVLPTGGPFSFSPRRNRGPPGIAAFHGGGPSSHPWPTGLTPTSTEAEVDAYLSNPAYYPIGSFDDTPDGNGDPMHNSALFRTDLAASWGTQGGIARLDNFSNLVYTALLDPTNLTTAGGRAFLVKLGGAAAGNEIVDGYIQVLAATGVVGYPYTQVTAQAVSEDAPLGIRVDNIKLLDMNAYLNSLQAPPGVVADAAAGARGRVLFRNNCTSCHNVDQSKPVPAFIVPMKTIFPGDNPVTLLAMRTPPLNPILDTPTSIFDDKAAVVNASMRGGIRGAALPLLLDLPRKPNFLHDSSVPSLDNLLNPTRGPTVPHPFYLADPSQRADMVEFLRGLSTTP